MVFSFQPENSACLTQWRKEILSKEIKCRRDGQEMGQSSHWKNQPGQCGIFRESEKCNASPGAMTFFLLCLSSLDMRHWQTNIPELTYPQMFCKTTLVIQLHEILKSFTDSKKISRQQARMTLPLWIDNSHAVGHSLNCPHSAGSGWKIGTRSFHFYYLLEHLLWA